MCSWHTDTGIYITDVYLAYEHMYIYHRYVCHIYIHRTCVLLHMYTYVTGVYLTHIYTHMQHAQKCAHPPTGLFTPHPHPIPMLRAHTSNRESCTLPGLEGEALLTASAGTVRRTSRESGQNQDPRVHLHTTEMSPGGN